MLSFAPDDLDQSAPETSSGVAVVLQRRSV